MFWLLSLLGAFLVGALLVFLLGSVFGRGEALPPVTEGAAKQQHWDDLGSGELTREGIRKVGFSLEIRGYNQSEVDFYLDRLARRIEELERQVGEQAGRQQTGTDQADTEQADTDQADTEQAVAETTTEESREQER